MAKKKENGFTPRPHANAKAHKKLMARLRKMTAEEIFRSAVEAGIYTEKGNLTKHYSQ